MAVTALPLPLADACPDCAGTGDINGAPCYSCDGARTSRPRRRRWSWRRTALRAVDAAAVPAGTVVRWCRSLPGAGGAAAVSYGAGWTAHSVWHPLPLWGAVLLIAGAFGLMMDRRL